MYAILLLDINVCFKLYLTFFAISLIQKHEICVVCYYSSPNFLSQKSKQIPGDQATQGINRKLTVLIEELMPGELYHFQFYTTAHGVKSENVSLSSRTSQCFHMTNILYQPGF